MLFLGKLFLKKSLTNFVILFNLHATKGIICRCNMV